MTEPNGSAAAEAKRVALNKTQKQRHLELLAKNLLLERSLKAKLKKVKNATKLCVEDLEQGSYIEGGQAELDLGDNDEPDARA